MGLDVLRGRAHAQHVKAVVDRLLLLKFDATICMLRQVGPQVVLKFAFIGEFERLLEQINLMVDCRRIWGKQSSIVDIENKDDCSLDKKARVYLGLMKAP